MKQVVPWRRRDATRHEREGITAMSAKHIRYHLLAKLNTTLPTVSNMY